MLLRKHPRCQQDRHKHINIVKMQTLRKKTSPLKYKNETSRFLGEGVSFKAKLIGILEVSEARGDRMCQDALSDLKMAIRAAGEHKQRITINIAIDGLRLRDEKTGDSLYHHPVHKISFIAQDMTDSRAFGYIFGSPDTGHRFFGIKTDKAASQVVIAMRDLFQVVFALKKKEIELAKQHLDKNRYGTSSLFSETTISSSKTVQETTKSSESESKAGATSTETRPTPAVADLVDLELELNSLQQGLTQMERITPSDPFGSKDDPFGDSFTSYPKPILPPPPSGRERASRTSESSSIFSPKTPHTGDTTSAADSSTIFNMSKDFNFSHEFNSSHDEPSSGDWFSPPPSGSMFEDQPSSLPSDQPKDQHEIKKQEILSQFDVFTELDPLGMGTGKSKPYIDKKHFFQELKNPPKKVLNDLVSESQQQTQPQEQSLFTANFDQSAPTKLNNLNAVSGNLFSSDPFGEDPFDKTDPFADFSKQDPFESEFGIDSTKTNDLSEKFKFPTPMPDNIQPIYQSVLSKSPKSSMLEKQMSLSTTATRNIQFSKTNTFDAQFDKFEDKKFGKLTQMHENPSLDLSSESECAPEPPPRPANNLTQIKPPPLPPKKQPGDSSKPPPRPPHTDSEPHYDYMDNYETGPNSLEFIKNLEKSPPLPVPARKSKFESDFTTVPERPKKQFNLQTDEDYLTPISFPQKKDHITRHTGPLLLPPPQRSNRKQNAAQQNMAQVTVASFLESKPNVTTSTAAEKLNCSLEGLDITLSQLTLSGLNELAAKLNIPPSQLSNMTLVQLTTYLSNFIKNCTNVNNNTKQEINSNTEEPSFKADFAANFSNFNNANSSTGETYDRYAVFRELLQEEIKQTKIDTEPEEIAEEKQKEVREENEQKLNNLDVKPLNDNSAVVDKYAALREIVENEIKQIEQNGGDVNNEENEEQNEEQDPEVLEKNSINEEKTLEENLENETNIIKNEKKFIVEEKGKEIISPKDVIEYNTPLDGKKEIKATTPIKSPVKSPVNKLVKSPVPGAVTDVIQNNTRLNSGSLSDVISGSSPEVDNTGSASEVAKKADATGESWAIFDQPNLTQETGKDKQNVQSEEGVSPWSSDSKEFGNNSPPEWRQRGDSGSGGDHWSRREGRGRRDQEGWWDTSAEPDVQYYPANRRSTDSYEDEYYECYDKPRRRRNNWSGGHGGQAAGGHSSSSRDVSPWEEEPRRRDHRERERERDRDREREHRDGRETRQTWSSRHTRQHSFERHRDRRHNDSWDEEDDYEYEEEHSNRFHWPERHSSRESDRERHSGGSREMDSDRWADEWADDRRHRRRREPERDRWCCPDWEQDKPPSRYNSGRWSNPDASSGKWRERKHEPDRYYSRDSQESPWEDDFSNDPEESHSPHYLTAKRNWKRPSSASEMDRKTGEIKSRPGPYYLSTGGSDGERDRRYKSGRRSKSRDSQFNESAHRHKPDPGLTLRGPHRGKPHPHPKPQFENDFIQEVASKKIDPAKVDLSNKKPSTLTRNKKPKESPKTEEINVNTFPRKATSRAQSLFENDFVTSETESPASTRVSARFSFENDFETSEADSPIVHKPVKNNRANKMNTGRGFESDFSKDPRRQTSFRDMKPTRFQSNQKSLFEDDFSPTEKPENEESSGISSIKEEASVNEEEDSFNTNNFDRTTSSRKKILAKNRLSGGLKIDMNLKKSESVNIFARENDPFDDDFFSGNDCTLSHNVPNKDKVSPRNTELKWTEEFEDFDIQEERK